MKPPRRAQPEARLQIDVKQYLGLCLPPNVLWTASLAGHGRLTMAARNKAKAMGLKPGWPDLQFLFPDGVTRYIELKSDVGSLREEQKAFRDRAAPFGVWALCRSVDEVANTLRGWGVRLRDHPFENYGAGAPTAVGADVAAQARGQGNGPGPPG